jgi:hypothetical protein
MEANLSRHINGIALLPSPENLGTAQIDLIGSVDFCGVSKIIFTNALSLSLRWSGVRKLSRIAFEQITPTLTPSGLEFYLPRPREDKAIL